MTHSPLPWRLFNLPYRTSIVDANGEFIADDEWYEAVPVDADNQAIIVTAVNAHAALVAALEAMQKFYEPMRFDRESDNAMSGKLDQQALAALELSRKSGA